MNADTIQARVIAIAERFGPENPQEFRLLVDQLAKLPAQQVAEGLLLVFRASPSQQTSFPRQELAGRLLAALAPKAEFDLEDTLRAVLPAWNLSVEQLPRYLASMKGEAAVIEALTRLQTEFGKHPAGNGASTMRWWLRDKALKR